MRLGCVIITDANVMNDEENGMGGSVPPPIRFG
jgi:hypothetical protein